MGGDTVTTHGEEDGRRTLQPMPDHAGSVRSILGVDVRVLTREQAVDTVRRALAGLGSSHFAFLNAHGANMACANAHYRNALSRFCVFSDGIGVDLGSKLLFGEAFPANLNGTDFVPHLLETLDGPLTVGLLGARAGIAERAAETFSERAPQHRYRVVSDGYFEEKDEAFVLRSLEDDPVDILLVALGNPSQELWIAKHCRPHMAKTAFGVGALFDFMAGHVERAPPIFIRMRCEWVYRLWLEPGRMWRRYIVGNPLFLMRILRQKFTGWPNRG